MQIPPTYPEDLAALNIFRYITYSSLIFHVWEWAAGFSFEVNHIWRKPHSSVVKWQYLWSRYIGIIGQIVNTVMTGYIHTTYAVPRQVCLGWFIEQMVVCQGLLFSLELSLVQRLYALSGSNNQLKMALYTLVFAENLIYVACLAFSARRVELLEACLLKKPIIELAIVGCAVGITQCILWTLTVRSSWKQRAPLSSLMIRDGSWVFGLVSVLIVGGAANTYFPKDRPVVNPFSAFVAVIVNANCRLIINLEDMGRKQEGNTSIIELTSFIDIGEHPSEVLRSHPSQSSMVTESVICSAI
ncbi:hypothetical protein BDZ94DRAFT_1248671 [Collybia nuda]|uniref:DUF6533 domain-containing protein n=1 Tax=Collybia nuda TaxID=64659 RepID=A0A9P5YFD0_9AGAR|nr:hypothetical protein BDZ94DRAFT_1248671 [Collybia nuda]